MPRTCIITDSTAYFTKPAFAGQEHITILPHQIQINGQSLADCRDLSLYQQALDRTDPPVATPPSVEAFQSAYSSLGMKYKDIVVILISSHLSLATHNANLATQ
jgi:fatty acid-binding protein DegV